MYRFYCNLCEEVLAADKVTIHKNDDGTFHFFHHGNHIVEVTTEGKKKSSSERVSEILDGITCEESHGTAEIPTMDIRITANYQFRIKEIAETTDESLSEWKNTPIYELSFARRLAAREFARMDDSMEDMLKDTMSLIKHYDDKIREAILVDQDDYGYVDLGELRL